MKTNLETYYRVARWAHVLAWQVERLRASRRDAYSVTLRMRETRIHRGSDNEAFFRLEAESHFTMTAAAHLRKALLGWDGDLRVPESAGVNADQVKMLRDALEHWDEPDGRAQRALQELEVKADDHQWDGATGAGKLGGLVEDEALKLWASAVYQEFGDLHADALWLGD